MTYQGLAEKFPTENGPPDRGRAGPAATGTGSKIHSRNNSTALVGEPLPSVNADLWETFTADPQDHERCFGCGKRGILGKPLQIAFFGSDVFRMHSGCAIGLMKARGRSGGAS
jgi:hypothetical protein